MVWYGQSLFEQVLFPGDVSEEDLQHWTPGSLYRGGNGLDVRRWRFWRDGFEAVASLPLLSNLSGKGEEKGGFGEECRSVAKRAAGMMEALERGMSF